LQETVEFGGERGADFEGLAGTGLPERELGGVEKIAAQRR
jgi:hypothetical protein